jgi:predicted RNA-binding protein (virulence factor B family)
MLAIGQINKMQCSRLVEFGAYFRPESGGDEEILLPRRFVTEGLKHGDVLELFVCYDSEDRLMATTEWPYLMVGQFASLKVKAINNIGAFLDWGLGKDLFLPYSDQTRDLRVGDYVVVRADIDKSDRIYASMRLDRFLEKLAPEFLAGTEVSAMIVSQTDLGYKAIVNSTHWGLFYLNEVFEKLTPGQKVKAYIKEIRADGKIDLSLHKTGHTAAEPIAELILEKIKAAGGFLNLTDKTDPARIYDLFGVSKKKYKIALGGLYKKRLILVRPDGIELLPQKK